MAQTASSHAPPLREGLFRSAAFFSYGFRPFFFGAGAYAALAMAAWLAWIAIHAAGGMPRYMTIAEPTYLWHAHEMVFGFAAAAIAGFLLTAVPNWTGTLPKQGGPLAALFGLWVAGRLAMWLTGLLPTWLTSLSDAAFLPTIAVVIARQLSVKPARHNVMLLSVVFVLAAANIWFHLERLAITKTGMSESLRFGVHLLTLMVAVIGGRIVPSFTRNVLARRRPQAALPALRPRLDAAAIALTALTAAFVVLPVPDWIRGAVALTAGIANGLRLAGWRGQDTLHEPILWVLHVAFLWLVVGLTGEGLAILTGVLGESAAMHALSTGAIGSMILAVMTRVALGHSGRPILASRAVVVAYALVSLAALLRVLGATVWPRHYNEAMLLAGLAWTAAFATFSVVYAPILFKPHAHP